MKARGLLAAFALTAVIAAPAPVAAQARDWTKAVVATPEGGFRMGNPAAKVKLVEYASLTCPHCAHFAETSKAPLMQRVRTGNVSYEFRNYVLNGIDVTATLLARCAGPQHYFAFTDRLYATQKRWVGRISGLTEQQKTQIQSLPDAQRLGRIAELGGLTAVAAQFGVAAPRARQCLADDAALERLGEMAKAAQEKGVQGTPTFFINDRKVDSVDDWAGLEPHLMRAGG